jgi:dihydroorotate dehydrogenase electron transfer subunit
MPVQTIAKIVGKEKLAEGIYKFSMKSKEITESAKPGNFLEIKVSEKDNTEPFLRRPISIFNIDRENDVIEFVFQVKGKGTKLLMERKVGDDLDIIGPLGYGTFAVGDYKKVAIIGGGIGTYPLYELAKELKDNSEVDMYLGFRNKELVTLEDEFRDVSSKFILTTDDGSYGEKGYAIDFLKTDCKEEKPDIIFACGPLPMLKAVQQFANENNIQCQMSLEERMGCGIQACVGCAVKVVKNGKEGYEYVCKQGPVFDSKVVVI